MNTNVELDFKVIFKIVCASLAFSTTIWCCLEFGKNEDMCEVSYKRFLQDDQSIYPELTVIIPYQLNENAFQSLGADMNVSTFNQILLGQEWDDEILKISLEDVKLKSDNYLISSCTISSYLDECRPIKINEKMFLAGSISLAFQLPRDKLTSYATFRLRKSIFRNGAFPENRELTIIFQYPNRIYRSQGSLFDIGEHFSNGFDIEDEKHKNHVVDFQIRDMEVLQRRKKRGNECLEDYDYDKKKQEEMMSEVGCRPLFWNHSTIDRICQNQAEFTHLIKRNTEIWSRLNQTAENDIPPCREIQKLQVDHTVKTAKKAFAERYKIKDIEFQDIGNDTWFEITLRIQTDTFKEIKQKRAYTPQSLVGNIGGYLGLFIGFTLLDLFDSMMACYSKILNCIRSPARNENKK